MIWQDVVIGVGQFAFALVLIPSIRSRTEKPVRSTCAMTALLLFLFGFVYFTLGLLLATSSVLLCGAFWTVLLFQRRGKKSNARHSVTRKILASYEDEHCGRHGI